MKAFTEAQQSRAADYLERWLEGWGDLTRRKVEYAATYTLAAVSEDVALLIAELEECKRPHYVCEDCWYSCRLADGCNDSEEEGLCSCGADRWNARIDAAIARWNS